MTTYAQRQKALRRGSLEAMRAMARLDRDPGDPVDVFGVIEERRVWLMFRPLDHLYGFYDREGETAGIVIHNGHPLSLQRFTAAHELGHYLLGHQPSIDSAREINASARDMPIEEIEAQAFAADFLMPPELVNRALNRLGLADRVAGISAMDAYQLSLEMGSSYRATVTQLNVLGFIGRDLAEELRRSKPIEIKADLGDGQRPENSRSDVWLVTDGLVGRQLYLRLEDEVHVRLPEIPTGGYRWDWRVQGDPDALELVDDRYDQRRDDPARVGASRYRHLWFRALKPTRGQLEARLVRAWQGPDAVALDEVRLPLKIVLPRTGQVPEGVSRRQRQPIAA